MYELTRFLNSFNEKTTASYKDLSRMQTTLCLAEEMGEKLGIS
jgi:hypothetical protein